MSERCSPDMRTAVRAPATASSLDSYSPHTITAVSRRSSPLSRPTPLRGTGMKITKLETFLVKPRWLFLKMHTDEGLIGLGEPILEGRARTVAEAVAELAEYLVGQDPRRIEHHWQAMYRHAFYRGGPILTSAISGVEQAMWDILGQSLGVPVYQLLGGACRDRIRVYAHCGGKSPPECAANARAMV